jgi:hypothetical protein
MGEEDLKDKEQALTDTLEAEKKDKQKEEKKDAPKPKRTKMVPVELPENTEILDDEEDKVREAEEETQGADDPEPPRTPAKVKKPEGPTTKCPVCGKMVKTKGLGKHMELAPDDRHREWAANNKKTVDTNKELVVYEKDEEPLDKKIGRMVEEAKEQPLMIIGILGGLVILAVLALIIFSRKDEPPVQEGFPAVADPVVRMPVPVEEHKSEDPVVEENGQFYRIVGNANGGYDKVLVS